VKESDVLEEVCKKCNGIGKVYETHNDKYGHGVTMKFCDCQKGKEMEEDLAKELFD
jgi:uncharacterized protein YcfJ